MHLYPGYRLLPVPIRSDFFYERRIGLYDLVATHAPFYAGNPGNPALFGVYVAIQAWDFVVPCVYLMAELYRLFRRKVRKESGVDPVADNEGSCSDNPDYDKRDNGFHVPMRWMNGEAPS